MIRSPTSLRSRFELFIHIHVATLPPFVLSKFNHQDDPRPEFNSVQRKQDSSCLFRRLSRVLSLMPVAQIAASKRRINTYTRLLFMTRDQQ